jgi:hypothetical protein
MRLRTSAGRKDVEEDGRCEQTYTVLEDERGAAAGGVVVQTHAVLEALTAVSDELAVVVEDGETHCEGRGKEEEAQGSQVD